MRVKKIDDQLKKEVEELKGKQEDNLEEIKFKAFMKLLDEKNPENENPELFYKIHNKLLKEILAKDIKYSEEYADEKTLDLGTYFIKNQKDFIVIQKKEGFLVRYCIKVIDAGSEFIIYIEGMIRIDEQKKLFRIYQRYPNSHFSAVFNGFKLKQLMEIFNMLFVEKYRSEEKNEKKYNKIDAYLSGKISR